MDLRPKAEVATFAVVTLGCTKNVVDSEGISQVLAAHGRSAVDRPADADAIIVNTCGFIGAAKQESIDTLLELAAGKRPGQILVASGCLVERYAAELAQEVPALDALVGVHRWPELPHLLDLIAVRGRTGGARVVRSAVEGLDAGGMALPPIFIGDGVRPTADLVMPRRQARGPTAYLKVSDGCDATCAFCAIPRMKGRMRSKAADEVVREARELAAAGVMEIVLVAQDTTAYGRDRGEPHGLPRLLRRLAAAVPDLPWVRIMYAYPQHVSDELLSTMAELPQVCNYLDVPLQHTHPVMLRRMRRPHGPVEELVGRIRDRVPGIALRTTFIVGFPGETEEEFAHLCRAVESLRFDRIGVFAYSREEGTLAHDLPDQVPERLKERRRRELMLLARRLSRERNQQLVGQTLDVLLEGRVRGRDGVERLVGRSSRDAPEVDGVVFVDGAAPLGSLLPVCVTAAEDYDLHGIPAGAPRTAPGDPRASGPHMRGRALPRLPVAQAVGAAVAAHDG